MAELIEIIKWKLAKYSKTTLKLTNLRRSAVMLIIYLKNERYYILLNKRSEKVEHHKGEISFPGGAKDAEDNTMLDVALRETYEEMGISPKDIQVLGELSEVATNSGFVINPFVATIPYPYRFQISSAEITEVIEMPLDSLLDHTNHREEAWIYEESLVRGFMYAYNEHLVYGATARILGQLVALLENDFR